MVYVALANLTTKLKSCQIDSKKAHFYAFRIFRNCCDIMNTIPNKL